MSVRAVLFDAAGTLVHLREPPGESYARIAARHGAAVPAGRLGEAFGRVFRAAPPMAFPGLGPEETALRERAWWRELARASFRAADQSVVFADFDACFAELWDHFASPAAWVAARDAHRALTALRAGGARLGVVSNFDGRLRPILAGLGLGPLLDVVVLPGDVGAAKPDPRPFTAALEGLGVAARDAVYVGDDPERDLAGARAAGLHAIDVAGLATLLELPARIHLPGSPRR